MGKLAVSFREGFFFPVEKRDPGIPSFAGFGVQPQGTKKWLPGLPCADRYEFMEKNQAPKIKMAYR